MNEKIGQIGKTTIMGLEEKLDSLLKPVRPDPDFVNSLKYNLTNTPSVMLEKGKNYLGILAVGLGLLAGVATYWMVRLLKK